MFVCYVVLPADGHNDWPKHVVGWNKSEGAKVGVLCLCVDWTVYSFRKNNDVAQKLL
jgi:hypothetical protein